MVPDIFTLKNLIFQNIFFIAFDDATSINYAKNNTINYNTRIINNLFPIKKQDTVLYQNISI